MFVLRGRRHGGHWLMLGPGARTLAVRSESGLLLWRDVAPGAKPEVFPGLQGGPVGFTPDGNRLYLDGWASGVYDLARREFAPFPEPADGSRTIALAPDGKQVLATYSPRRGSAGEERVEGWAPKSVGLRSPRWSVPVEAGGCGRPVPLPDGWFVLWEYRRPDERRYEYWFTLRSSRGRVLKRTAPTDEGRDWEAVSPDGRWVAAARHNRIRVWWLANPEEPPAVWQNDSKKNFTGLAFHPSGRFLAVPSNDGTVKLYETGTWARLRVYDWKAGKLTSIAFSPDGTVAASGTDTGRIVIWDVDG